MNKNKITVMAECTNRAGRGHENSFKFPYPYASGKKKNKKTKRNETKKTYYPT